VDKWKMGIRKSNLSFHVMLRRSSLSAAVALRQLAQRSQATAPAAAATSNAATAHLSSLDLSMEPTQRFRHIAAASPLLSKETKVSAEQLIGVDLAHPALLAAQVKDAALLSKVADSSTSNRCPWASPSTSTSTTCLPWLFPGAPLSAIRFPSLSLRCSCCHYIHCRRLLFS
jgi:hypothetical protein